VISAGAQIGRRREESVTQRYAHIMIWPQPRRASWTIGAMLLEGEA